MPEVRAQGKMFVLNSEISYFLKNHIFDHLLVSCHLDDSNKWSNIGLGSVNIIRDYS